MSIKNRIKELAHWARQHWVLSVLIVVALFLLQTWFSDLVSKAMFDRPNLAILRWIERTLGGELMPIIGQFIAEFAGAIPAVVAAVLFILIGRWSQSHIPRLKEPENRQKVEIRFDPSNSPSFSRTHFGTDREDEVIFVSVRPVAYPRGSYIRECRGYLDAVWKEGPNGAWLPIAIDDEQMLTWGSQGTGGSAKTGLDSERGRKLNIFFVRKRIPVIVPCIPLPLNKHDDVFDERRAIYRLDIRVSSYGESESGKISLKAQLGEQWNDINIERIADQNSTTDRKSILSPCTDEKSDREQDDSFFERDEEGRLVERSKGDGSIVRILD